jgi:hypothetical protein
VLGVDQFLDLVRSVSAMLRGRRSALAGGPWEMGCLQGAPLVGGDEVGGVGLRDGLHGFLRVVDCSISGNSRVQALLADIAIEPHDAPVGRCAG